MYALPEICFVEAVMEKYCVLQDGKICDECGQCNMCDLDPNKICDNCMKCVKSEADFAAIEIDEVFESEKIPPVENTNY